MASCDVLVIDCDSVMLHHTSHSHGNAFKIYGSGFSTMET